jgi:hypothetical protein
LGAIEGALHHAWTTALLATYEIHTHKHESQLQAGDILTVEGGTGRAFYREVDVRRSHRSPTSALSTTGSSK